MCLAAVAIGQSARFPWVLAANRDEFFGRAAAPLARWQPAGHHSAVLSGRDLSAGGTWMGLNASGRLALVTNVREPGTVLPGAPSRGELVLQCLQAGAGAVPASAVQALLAVPRNGFNLFMADLARADDALWVNNRPAQRRRLGAGLYGLSNAALDTPWPKVLQLKRRLSVAMKTADGCGDRETLVQALLAALADAELAPDAALPSTGLPLLRERQLSSAFIHIVSPDSAGAGVYGTRCSTVVVAERLAGRCVVHVLERSFDEGGGMRAESRQEFALQS